MRAVIALLLLAAVAGCDRQSAEAPQPNAVDAVTAGQSEAAGTLDMTKRGSAMPSEAFTGPDGATVTLASFKGRPLLVNLWATWCGPCVREMPSLDRLAARTGDKLQVVAVNQDSPQAIDPVAPWWAAHKPARLALYRDPKTGLGFAYASGMLPTTVLYDKEGKEVWRIVGGMDWDGPRANTLLAGLLG